MTNHSASVRAAPRVAELDRPIARHYSPVPDATAAPGRRLRVAMVAFDFGEVCVQMANALSRSVDIALILPERELRPIAGELDPAVHVVPFFKPRLRQPRRQARMCRTILRALDGFRAELVHMHQGHLWFNLVLPLLGARRLVVTVHDPTPHPGDRASRKTPAVFMNIGFRYADQLIVHAEQQKREVMLRRRLPARNVHVISHVAIGAPEQRPAAITDGRTVLFFGRIWPYKGLEYLIRAAPLITARVPDARFVIAGEGESFARYRALMHDPSCFTVLNEFVSIERRSELFAEAAVVVLPYVEASQSGVVPIAYSFEKPVVATAVGGLPEAIEHGRTGLVVAPRDHAALADAVVRLLADPGLGRDMGVAGRRKLEREASAIVVAERTLAVYDLASERGASAADRDR